MSPTIKALLLSARPKTLWAAAAPVIMGTAIAHTDAGINWLVTAATLTCAILIQVGTNYANDYYDFVKGIDTTDRVGPTRATAAGLVSPRQMKAAFIATFAAAALMGCYLIYKGGWPIAVIGIVSIACGVLYTAGPFPLGYLGFGDLFVLVFFGPVSVGGTYYLQTGQITPTAIIAGLAPGLISTAILTVNNFRDYHTDSRTGKRTLVVRFGRRFGKVEYIACLLGACAIALGLTLAHWGHFWANLSLLTLAAAYKPVRAVLTEARPEILNRTLAQTGLLLLIYSVLFSVGWLL
ncbi:MAG: hypothetical protein AMJ65_00810 [Phycisphaerae bacterium SG8_4]|nr:MAG: hypothetical protein AMJ65_00810 [Phycisphaerae bacterium SG8_4]